MENANQTLLDHLAFLKEVCPDPHVVRFYALFHLLGMDGIKVLYSRKQIITLKKELRHFTGVFSGVVAASSGGDHNQPDR